MQIPWAVRSSDSSGRLRHRSSLHSATCKLQRRIDSKWVVKSKIVKLKRRLNELLPFQLLRWTRLLCAWTCTLLSNRMPKPLLLAARAEKKGLAKAFSLLLEIRQESDFFNGRSFCLTESREAMLSGLGGYTQEVCWNKDVLLQVSSELRAVREYWSWEDRLSGMDRSKTSPNSHSSSHCNSEESRKVEAIIMTSIFRADLLSFSFFWNKRTPPRRESFHLTKSREKQSCQVRRIYSATIVRESPPFFLTRHIFV